RVVLSIFLFASAVRGQAVVETTPGQQQNQAPASPKPGETCTVEGTVVKATTGEGLRKITVQLFPVGRRSSAERRAQPVSALTDSGGRIVFQGIAAGRYSMMASDGSYTAQRYAQRGRFGAGKILDLAAGQIEKDIVFPL